MKNDSNVNNICFCFVDGEPHLYNKQTRIYSPLNLSYNEVLELVKKQIPTKGKRPVMAQIWVMLNNLIPCSSKYYSGYNERSKKFKIVLKQSFLEILLNILILFGEED